MTLVEFGYWGAALLGHGALWVEIVNRFHGLGWERRTVDRLTTISGIVVAGLPIAAAVFIWRGSTPGWLTGYATVSLAALLAVAVTRIARPWDASRDRLSRLTNITTVDMDERLGDRAIGSPRLARLAKLPGNQLLKVAFEERTVPLAELPEPLEGLRVAHLTDLHMSGRLTIDYFQEVIAAINAWGPDLVFITGDIVEHTPQHLWVDDTLGALTPAVGSYFVLGNHDKKIDHQETRRRLTSTGLVDLGSRTETIEHRGVTITLGGDERPWFGKAPPFTNDESFKLCLVHTPDCFGWSVRQGVDLVLAGHCHGGQVCFPLLGPLVCPSKHGVRYASGTFRRGRTVMHVGRGTGSLFPLRYNCPPEVALLTLTRDTPSFTSQAGRSPRPA